MMCVVGARPLGTHPAFALVIPLERRLRLHARQTHFARIALGAGIAATSDRN